MQSILHHDVRTKAFRLVQILWFAGWTVAAVGVVATISGFVVGFQQSFGSPSAAFLTAGAIALGFAISWVNLRLLYILTGYVVIRLDEGNPSGNEVP